MLQNGRVGSPYSWSLVRGEAGAFGRAVGEGKGPRRAFEGIGSSGRSSADINCGRSRSGQIVHVDGGYTHLDRRV